jgi:glyoxylase-like metal-dependent hydrolase (beta-lactamase superfamily II)
MPRPFTSLRCNATPDYMNIDTIHAPYTTAEPISPLVRRVLARNPSAFTYTGTQTYLVGTRDVAIIDPGPDDEEHVAAIIQAVGTARVRAIMCTHTHRDHSPAAATLRRMLDAPVIGCAPLMLDDDGPRADAAFDPDYAPDQVLQDGDRLGGDGWTIAALATPGHTSNHLCYDVIEEQALFTGDHIMGWSTSVVSPPDGDMADYMRSLGLLLERDDKVYYPAHGPQIDTPQRLARGMMGHRKQREGQIIRLLESGTSFIPDMVTHMYKGIDPRLHPAAGRSVLAHLIDLDNRGRVAREGDAWRLTA